MTMHNNLFGWSGDKYSLWDNCWLWIADGVFICEKTAWYRLTGVGGGGGGGGSATVGVRGSAGENGTRIFRQPIEIPAGIYPVKIGAGANGNYGSTTAASQGGDTSLGSLITLGGGGATPFSGEFSSAFSGTSQSVPGFHELSHLWNIAMNAPNIIDGKSGIAAAPAPSDSGGLMGTGYGLGGSGAFDATVGVGRYGGNGTPGLLFIELISVK